MKVRIYHAGDGDCLLLSDESCERRVLIDGGRAGTFQSHTAPHLPAEGLDVVCVSHIDDDHISGILRLFDTEVEWRRHEFREDRGLSSRRPRRARPPRVNEIWHNALFELVGDDLELRAINALQNTASFARARHLEEEAIRSDNIVNGERSALKLSRRISANELNVELNDSSNGKVMTRDSARGRRFGSLRVSVIGPSEEDISRLRDRWRRWIDDHPTAIEAIREALREEESQLATSSNGDRLGDGASSITPPNLASIMLLAEEGDHSILLTGDGDSAEILRGLEAKNKVDPVGAEDDVHNLRSRQRFHATVFKIPHHGALANVTEELVARVTADHYVFCGNGAHDNPEIKVLQELAVARLDRGVGPDTDFTFWFSSGSQTEGLTEKRRDHMNLVETEVEKLVRRSGDRMSARFMQGDDFLDVL